MGPIVFADMIEKSLTTTRPRDCSEIYNSGGHSDGVYTVHIGRGQHAVQVYCDMTTAGRGWTVCIRVCCNIHEVNCCRYHTEPIWLTSTFLSSL